MGFIDDEKNLSRAERLERKRQRQERIRNRAKAKAEREAAIATTIYGTTSDPNLDYSSKPYSSRKFVSRDKEELFDLNKNKFNKKEEDAIKDRNNKRKLKKGQKVKFKDLSPKEKFKKIFKVSLLVIITLILLMVVAGAIFFNVFFKDELKLSAKDLLLKKVNSEVYDRDGKQIAVLAEDEKRRKVDLKDMSPYLPKAYIAIEDERFYSHSGIDIKRTFGAVANFALRKGTSSYGGSTITQQLIKNLTKDDKKDWKRKVREISRALQVEKEFSKDEILELYLNLIYVGGNNIYGIALGSDKYFSKTPKDLSIAESAFMAGINHTPASYDPFISKSEKETDKEFEARKTKRFDLIKKRTNTVLAKMKELNYINDEQYKQAVSELEKGLNFKEGALADTTVKYSSMVDATINEAISIIAEKEDIKEEAARYKLYNGGYKIYSSQDSKVQEKLEEEMKKSKYIIKSSKKKEKTSQASGIIIDHKTGEVMGAVGGLGDETQMYKDSWNRVTRTKRQTGSIMKTIGVVSPGIESGKLTAATGLNDAPLQIGSYKPKNYTGRFQGWMTLRHALELSENIPQIRALQEIGIDTSYKFLKKMNFPVTEDDKNLGALALGGLQHGATVQDMVGAYGMIANDGVFSKPTYIKKITDNDGKEVYKNEPEKKQVKMMSKEASFIVKDMLRGVITSPSGTAGYATIPNFDSAGKTGTTNDDYDRWFAGFTNKYTMAVWYGFDEVETVVYRGNNPAGMIWTGTMREIHKGLQGEKFEEPKEIVKMDVCGVSGKKPTAACSLDPRGTKVYSEYFVKGTEPKDECDIHQFVEVCKESGLLPSKECRPEDKERRVFIKQDVDGAEDTKYRAPSRVCDQCSSANRQKTEEAKRKIENINSVLSGNVENMTSKDISRYENAISAYNSLSSEDKEKVSKEAKSNISAAQEKIKKLKEETENNNSKAKQEGKAVMDLIAALPEASSITAANKASASSSASNARAKYNALSQEAKKNVTNYAKLKAVEDKIAEL